jgi:CheY-like chemotaxis protein
MSGSPKKILIVEDDRDIRDSLSEILVSEGYSVERASNGQEGLDLLRRGLRPNLILLDLMMPVKDGYEFRAEQLTEPAEIANIPLVVMSADGRIMEKKNRVHANEYIRKPVELDSLLESIKKHTT